MYILVAFIYCITYLQIGVFGELSPSSCSLLRTGASISTIVPEMAQIAMRYYRVVSSSSELTEHHRHKRFIFDDSASTATKFSSVKGSVFEPMVANAFKDVNFTAVTLLILNNNETMNKIRQNVQGEAILRAAMRNLDYENLGSSLWYAAKAELNSERFIYNLINMTNLNLDYEELVNKSTLPDQLIESIHPSLNAQVVQRMLKEIKAFANKFITRMNSTENLEDYLFNMTQEKILIPFGKTIERIKTEKPATLDQLIEIILNDVNKVVRVKFLFICK